MRLCKMAHFCACLPYMYVRFSAFFPAKNTCQNAQICAELCDNMQKRFYAVPSLIIPPFACWWLTDSRRKTRRARFWLEKVSMFGQGFSAPKKIVYLFICWGWGRVILVFQEVVRKRSQKWLRFCKKNLIIFWPWFFFFYFFKKWDWHLAVFLLQTPQTVSKKTKKQTVEEDGIKKLKAEKYLKLTNCGWSWNLQILQLYAENLPEMCWDALVQKLTRSSCFWINSGKGGSNNLELAALRLIPVIFLQEEESLKTTGNSDRAYPAIPPGTKPINK